jgi:nucleoside-diphosphate-sugar epimerase
MGSQRIVVTGVSGNIGWGVAKALLGLNLEVIGVTRSESSVAKIADSLGNPATYLWRSET